jgi:flavin-dependent dehydrogenase
VIAADGVNSRTAETVGLNRRRKHFATALCIIYSLEGVAEHDPAVMTWHMGQAYGSYAPVIKDPSLHGTNVADLVVMGSANLRPESIFKHFTTQSPCAPLFKNARILKRTGCTVKAYSSLLTPYAGNVLLAGDAAAYIEVEVQGALMCGYRAGGAAVSELNGRGGFEQYAQWWRDTFEFNSEDALRVAQGYALVPAYSDDEIDYLFSLIENTPLDGAYGQYKAPRLLWEAVTAHTDTIKRERPALYEKINNNSLLTFENTFQQK